MDWAILLLVSIPVAVGLLLVYLRERERRGYRDSLSRVRAALIRLRYKPDDPEAIRSLATALADGKWLKSGYLIGDSELWKQSLDIGFGHIAKASGKYVLHEVVRPLWATSVCNPPELLRWVQSTVSANPEDEEVLATLTSLVASLPPPSHGYWQWLRDLISRIHSLVREHPTNHAVHNIVLRFLGLLRVVPPEQTQWLYERTLDLVKTSPKDAESAVLALEVGRWHCSRSRPDGKVTVYDEQMIRNDIAVRTGT